ncbi:MAG: FAD/NAD(P)-binding oxidoreductase [Clostridia bacterium]|nr:FAD/NAD(P)-binding oxidoreductase [Clostridia bacterium]
MQKTSVVILGAGIVGAFVFNTLTQRGVKAILLEKGEDVCLGASKANSGIIHAGYDCAKDTLKAKFNVLGNKMFPKIAKRLGEKILDCGSLVVGDENGLETLKTLLERGIYNGVKNIRIIEKDELHALEPNLNDNICFGLFSPDAKIISPYTFCISLCEEAIVNGGKLLLNFDATSIKKIDNRFEISNGNDTITAEFVINCTAENVNSVNSLIDEKQFDISLVKGEYMLFDNSQPGFVSRPIFPIPTEKSKGIVACPTTHGNFFLGPTAKDVSTYDTSFSYDSINEIKSKSSLIIKNVNYKKVIKLYAGVRVKVGDDFEFDFSEKNKGFVTIAGICSPGLSSAPAIAKFVVDKLVNEQNLKTKKVKLKKRKVYTNILNLSPQKLNVLIKKNKDYGEIVCNCETLSKGEVLEVLRGPISPLTTDGVKRRLRATMGHCQGSFCYSTLVKVMSEFYKLPEEKIIMRGKQSLVLSDIKEGGIYEND